MSDRRFKRDRQQRLERQARRQRNLKRAAIAGGAAFCAGAFAAPAANAATFTVTNLTDADPGSLRDAVDDANSAAGDDDVVFQAGLTGQITLTSGEIPISEAVSISGPGASALTISGNDNSRIFNVDLAAPPPSEVSVSGLTLTDGNHPYSGGAIMNYDSTFTLSDSVISSSEAGAGGGGLGGGLGSLGPTIVERSTITGNSVYDEGLGYGGGIGIDGGKLTMRDSKVTGNYSEDGGGGIGLYDLGEYTGGASLIERSTISGNEAGEDGAGVYLEDSYLDATLTIDASTITNNDALFRGGGLCICEDPFRNTTVTNSTISGNRAEVGGGVFNDSYLNTSGPSEGRELFMTGVTIAGNHAYDVGGGIARASDTYSVVQLTNAIVADNTAVNGDPDLFSVDPAPADEIAARYSLIETAGSPFTDQGRNIVGVDPQLGPLASNGGPTQTHLPALPSPVLDKGLSSGLTTDQRGEARPFDLPGITSAPAGDAADMGAVESGIVPGSTPAKKKKKKCKKKRAKGKAGASAKKCKKKKKK